MPSTILIRGCHLGSAVALIVAASPSAPAQNAPARGEGQLEEITVTAQRREQSLQSVPISITAITAADMEARQIVNTYDVAEFVPNLHVFNNAGSLGTANAYYIRGIGNPESIATTDVPVGTYIDDVYVPRQQSANLALFDIERVEVLRGPQGTLFGRNTTGGAVSIVTRKPGAERRFNAEAAFGRFNQLEGRATLDLPLSERFYTSFSAFYGEDDGWIRGAVTGADDYNLKETWGLRAATRWMPTDAIDWNLNVTRTYTANWRAANWAPATAPQPLQISSTFSRSWETTLSRNPTCNEGESPQQWFTNRCDWNEVSETAITSNLQVDLGGPTLAAITGFRKMDHRYNLDFIGNAPVGFSNFYISNDGDHDMFSQEIKLSGTLRDDRITYAAGVFYMKEKNKTFFQDIFGIARGTPFVGADRTLWNDTTSYAAYAQGDFRIGEKFTLTAGARYTQEEKDLRLDFRVPTRFTEAGIAGRPNFTDSAVTPKLSLQYQASEAVMVYGSATNGFKSGGWNGRATNTFAFRDFGPEQVWSYEAGVRSDLLDRRLRLNANVFWAEYTDLQLNSAIPGSQPPVFIAQNAGDSRTKGVELEVSAIVTEGLDVFLNAGLQDAKFTRLSSEAVLAGLTLASAVAGSPDYSLDGGFSYRRPLTSGALALSTSLHYSPEFNRALTATRAVAPSVLLVSASLGYTFANPAWEASLECTNCSDEKYFPFGSAQADPLRYMLRLRFRP
jgi:iron complex outermembrane receptor protein